MTDYDDGNNVLVRFHHRMPHSELTKAHHLFLSANDTEGVWIPKSLTAHLDDDAGEVWIPIWLAEEKGLEYE